MVKYALVRHPNNYIALGISRDVESQREILLHNETDETCTPQKHVLAVMFTFAIMTFIVSYAP
jgi:hypothetical protein